MKCLIVLSLLCIAANAYTETDDDVLVEKLLKRYEELQERKRTKQEDCAEDVRDLFSDFVGAEHGNGKARDDLGELIRDCAAAGGVYARTRLTACLQYEANLATSQGRRSFLFARQGNGCAQAAAVLNQILDDTNAGATMEQICNFNGGVRETMKALSDCVNPMKDPNPQPPTK